MGTICPRLAVCCLDPAAYRVKAIAETGRVLTECRLPEKAIPFLEEAVAMSERDCVTKMLLAACYRQLKNTDKAIEVYDRILEKFPYYLYTWVVLADLYFKLEDFDNAIINQIRW